MLSRTLLSLLALIATCHFAKGQTVVSVGGQSAEEFAVYAATSSSTCWNQSQTYSDVSIAAPVSLWTIASNPNPTGRYHGTAYLTASIGPLTTTAIASTSFTGTNTSPQSIGLFSGLTLGPGFYCLTFAGTDQEPPGPPVPVGYLLLGANAPGLLPAYSAQIVTAPGVELGFVLQAENSWPAWPFCGQACVNSAFPPASMFVPYFTGSNSAYLQFSVTGQASNVSAVGSMAQIASGGVWNTTFTLVNNDTSATQVVLNFFDDNGNALLLPLTFPQTSSTVPQLASAVNQTINAGAELVIQTAGTASQATQEGWAQLLANGNIGGSAVFGWTTAAGTQEAVVPVETRSPSAFVLSFDNTGGYATGVALANVSTQAVSVPVVLRDDTGASLGTAAAISLPAHAHTSFMLTDPTHGYLATTGKRGTLELDVPVGGQISALGIRANPDGAITSVPVAAK